MPLDLAWCIHDPASLASDDLVANIFRDGYRCPECRCWQVPGEPHRVHEPNCPAVAAYLAGFRQAIDAVHLELNRLKQEDISGERPAAVILERIRQALKGMNTQARNLQRGATPADDVVEADIVESEAP